MHALSGKSTSSARWGYVIQNMLYATSILLAWLFIAAAAIIIDPKMAAPDKAIFVVVERLMNPFLGGLVVAGLLAGLMSTTDSMILVLASAVSYDIYGTLKSDATESQLIKLSSIFVVVIGAATFFAAIHPPEFLTKLFMDAAGSIAACLFPVIALGIWWKRSNKYGALVSMVVGFFVYWIVALFKLLPPWSIITYTYILVIVLFVIVSLVTQPPSEEMTDRIAKLHA
jgi:Na+/proline symporter